MITEEPRADKAPRRGRGIADKYRAARRRTWELLSIAGEGDQVGRALDVFLVVLILLNVAAVVIGSMKSVQAREGRALGLFEVFSVIVFSMEYLARLWACPADPRYARPVIGRMRYALRPGALLDLLAVLPFYVAHLGMGGADLRFVRVLRLLRIVRIAKLGRYLSALRLFTRVLHAKREELIMTFAVVMVVLLLVSSMMYYVENGAQPDKFSDIPSSMWWAVTCLTSVGYGDVYPITPLGKFIASAVALLGIGVIAVPTGIIGSGFVEEMQNRKRPTCCPHCGKELR